MSYLKPFLVEPAISPPARVPEAVSGMHTVDEEPADVKALKQVNADLNRKVIKLTGELGRAQTKASNMQTEYEKKYIQLQMICVVCAAVGLCIGLMAKSF